MAPKRRAKRTVERTNLPPQAQIQNQKQLPLFVDQEVELETAIRAVRDVEIEHLVAELRLLRSYFTEEQLKMPVMQFFRENLPNLSIVNSKENKQVQVQWSRTLDATFSMTTSETDMYASLFRRFLMADTDRSAPFPVPPSKTGFQFSSKVLEGPSDGQTLGSTESLRNIEKDNRLSAGMPLKTRQPKRGEMLLSVHGSPLGIFKEDTWKLFRV